MCMGRPALTAVWPETHTAPGMENPAPDTQPHRRGEEQDSTDRRARVQNMFVWNGLFHVHCFRKCVKCENVFNMVMLSFFILYVVLTPLDGVVGRM